MRWWGMVSVGWAGSFDLTVFLVKEAGFSKIYVFKYSPRSGTKASKLPDDVPMEIKKKRNNCLLEEFKKEIKVRKDI